MAAAKDPQDPRQKKAAPSAADELRRRVEERLDGLSATAAPMPEDLAGIVHDLRVYQVEIEMQNEELRRAQLELQASREKYFELFDLAPVGYLTLSDKSIVRDANLTAARLLGVERRQLVEKPFTAFIFAPDQDVYYRCRRTLEESGEPQTCELRLRRAGAAAGADAEGGHFWARLESRLQPAVEGETLSYWVTFTDIDKAIATQEALRASEARSRHLFEAMPEGVVVIAVDGQITYANPAAESILGLKPSQVEGRAYDDQQWKRLRPDGTPMPVKETAIYRAINEKRLMKSISMSLVQSNGSVSWVSCSAAPLLDAGGEIEGAVGAIVDITDRVRAEEALRMSEEHYRDLVTELNDGVYVLDEHGVITFANSALANLVALGHPDQLVGRTIFEFITPATVDGLAAHFRQVVEGSDVGEPITVKFIRADGTSATAEVKAVVVSEGDRVVGMRGMVRDITERVRAEEKVAAAARQWRQTFDAMRDSVSLLDKDGEVLRCNSATTVLTGLDFAEIIGHPCCEVFHRMDHRLSGCPMLCAFESGQAETTIVEDHAGCWLRVTFAPAFDAAGRIVGGTHVVSDVSDLKLSEMRLLASAQRQEAITDGVIEALVRSVEVRDPYTAGHQRRVSELATAIAQHMGLDAERVMGVKVVGKVHDVGKIVVPAEILSKPGRLSAAEFDLIKAHPEAAFEVLTKIGFPWPVDVIALQHHERLDGSGYPNGLSGDEICLEARIIAVADVVEAMISHRPYRAALPLDAAMAELEDGAGSRYDAAVCEVALRLFREQGFAFGS